MGEIEEKLNQEQILRKLNKISREIEEAKSDKNQKIGRRDELLRVLKRDYGINDLQAAIREAKNIDGKVVKRNVRIESEFQKLTERYEI